MTPKPLAVFTADFPDDQVEDERDIVRYGGRNVAEAICQMVADLGGETSGLLYEGVKGWSFEARYHGRAYVGLLTSFHPRFFLTFTSPYLGGRLRPGEFADFWNAMDVLLRGHPLVRNLQWYEQEDAPDPFEGMPSLLTTSVEERDAARAAYRRARRASRLGCLLGIVSALAILVGAMKATLGIVALLVHDPGGSQTLIGALFLGAGGFGLWLMNRVWAAGSTAVNRFIATRR